MRNTVELLSFAAGYHKSFWSGCIKAAGDLSAGFLNFGAGNFPSKIPFRKCFKIVFFSLLASRSGFGAQFPTPLHVVLLRFAIQCLQIAFVKAAWCRGCISNTIVFCSWIS